MSAPIFDRLEIDKPSKKQVDFWKSTATHTAYGGARGGGKSWAMRRKLVMLAMRYDGLKLLLLRRTLPELRENHIIPLQVELYGYAKYNTDAKTFIFPNGSRLRLGYCDNDNDVNQYQGQEIDVIAWEEATNFKPDWIDTINSSVRTTRTDWSVRFYYTCNPGGVGHAYIKRLFIDRKFADHENPDDYYMVRATVYDNKVLMSADPNYVKRLETLPPHKRRAHLYGDWDVYEGQVFDEFADNPDAYDTQISTHVIAPFEPPEQWRIYRSFDFGYSKPFSVGWWAVDYDGRLYRIMELYGCVNGEPNMGVKWSPSQIFTEIANIEHTHKWLAGKHILGIADPAIWDTSHGTSIADVAAKSGVYFDKADNRRLNGWMQVHNRLEFDQNGIPMMYVFSNCHDTVRTLPLLQYDKNRVEDVDTDGEDHIADDIRYMCMAHPIAATKPVAASPYINDPLTASPKKHNRMVFYDLYG